MVDGGWVGAKLHFFRKGLTTICKENVENKGCSRAVRRQLKLVHEHGRTPTRRNETSHTLATHSSEGVEEWVRHIPFLGS